MAAIHDDSIAQVRPEERGFAAAVHFPLAAVPLWSFVFLLGMWMFFKERSREVVFHVQQAMLVAVVQHVAILCWVVFEVLLRPVALVSERAAGLVSQLNSAILVACLLVHGGFCLHAAFSVWLGRPYLYPVIGRRVLTGTLSKFNSGS